MPGTIVAANWKMNGSLASATGLSKEIARVLANQSLANCQPVLFPPAPFLLAVDQQIRGTDIALGGQDCSADGAGSFTGDLSAAMLRDVGCQFVIVGHSERRRFHGETNDTVRAKSAAAIGSQLTPVICVGESEHGLSSQELKKTLGEQVAGSLPDCAYPHSIVIAYEPVWAIGAAASAAIEHIDAAHLAIRSTLVHLLGSDLGGEAPILYGGSVNPGNCADIFSVDTVGGVLVGRSGLDAGEFVALVAAAEGRRARFGNALGRPLGVRMVR